jgi:hypothetical protein
MTQKQRLQYRVIWKREGNHPKSRRVASLGNAEKWVGLLTSNEPWKFLSGERTKPDDYMCCSGHECSCGGKSLREFCEAKREGLPKIEWIRIDVRTVSKWEAI